MRRSKKWKVMMAALSMALLFHTGGASPFVETAKAAGGTVFEPTLPKAVLADTLKPYEVSPGETVEVIIPVKASNYLIRKPIIEVDLSKTGGFSLASDVVFYTKTSNNPSSITVYETSFVKFSVYIPLNAKKGTYNDIPIKFITTDSFNDYTEVTLNQVSKLTFKVKEQRKLAEFSLVDSTLPTDVKENEEIELSFDLQNRGELGAKNVTATLEGYESLFRLDGSQPVNQLGDLKTKQSTTTEFKLIGAKNLPTSLAQLALVVHYENEDGSVAEPQKFAFSIQTIAKEEKPEEVLTRPTIQVVDVSYPRGTVNYGESFSVVYTLKNTGKVAAKNFVAEVTGYSEAGFKPAKAYDKKRKNLIKAGDTVELKMDFKAIESIASGIKPLALNFSYYSKDDKKLTTQITDSMNTYIDVKGKEEDKAQSDLNNSVPRLMISKYDTGEEKIMAGKIFNFSFDVLNSHSSVAADNIKATVSSADGTFSIVEGSASFYIPSLKAGEIKNIMIPLKVKGDIATNGYDVNIKFEYEYLKKETANGSNMITKQVTELNEALKLQVFSNDRPKLSNVRVGDGEPPKYMESTNLTFDFNNMGKSPLYNVTAEVKGDFKSLNDVLIIGNVNAGEGKSWSMEVTPMVENTGSGTLTISYEDSNGNVTSYDTAFNSEIMSGAPEITDMPDVPNIPKPEEKKDIMPLWAFILGNVILFFVGMSLSKNLIIKKYKKKKRAEIEKEDEEL